MTNYQLLFEIIFMNHQSMVHNRGLKRQTKRIFEDVLQVLHPCPN